MIIANKESYKNISIKSLDLSNRTINALHCGGIRNLYQLIVNIDKVGNLRNIGEKCMVEIFEILKKLSDEEHVQTFKGIAEKEDGQLNKLADLSCVSDKIKEISVKKLRINTRASNALIHSGILTMGQLSGLEYEKLYCIKNMGIPTANSVIEEFNLLAKMGDKYFAKNEDDETKTDKEPSLQKSRAIDIDTVNLLRSGFGLKMVVLSDILGISKQSLDQKLHKRINKGNWLNKELLPDEEALISDMISDGLVMRKESEPVCCILNNKQDNCCVLFVYSDDIKCFFLKDLSDTLQKKIKENGYDRFTSVELSVVKTLGKTEKILGEAYFVPSSDQFYRLAKSRGMNAEEYSIFLTGCKYCSQDKCITDDRIISFLRSNTKDGKTRIKQGSESRWLFDFAEEHGLNIEQLAEQYGFDMSIEKEPDMQVFDIASDAGYIEKIYAKYPLLGSKIISEANLGTINKNSRRLINEVMSSSDSKLTPKGKMIIALSVINYSKNWAYEDESKFWKYIAEQFGYRDETGRLGNILRGCVKDALTENNRCFISNEYGNKYKSTVLLHALATKETWYRYCDFLFNFYKENMDLTYVENDEIVSHMISFLGRKFNNDKDEEDENIKIGSNVYSFGEGLVKLIRYRPIYASKVADTLLKHIDARYNHRNPKPVCYEEELCDEWYDEYYKKIQLREETKQLKDKPQETRIARDYTRINPVYCLDKENNAVISFPDIRLKKVDFSSLQVEVLYKDNVVIKKSLKYYGNELGKTLKSFSVSLGEIMNETGADSIAPQIRIKCDEEIIYDSAERLIRKFIVFYKNSETEISNCSPGSYLFIAPAKDTLEFVNAETYDSLSGHALKGIYAILKEDFAVSFNDEIVAFDNKADQNVKLLMPKNRLKYIINGERYDIISDTDKIRILLNGESASLRYRLFINGKETVFDRFQSDSAGNGTLYTINANDFSDSLTSIRIFDLLKDKLIENRKTAVLPVFNCTFDKICYFTPNDYSDSLFTIENKDGYYGESSFEYGSKTVSIPYENGEIEAIIPTAAVTDTAGNVWDGSNRFWVGDISHDLFLSVDLPDGYRAEMYFGTYRVSEESDRLFGLGNTVAGYTNTKDDPSVDVILSITAPDNESTKYLIGKIYTKEQFVSPPKFYIDNGVLSWNKGYGFIGGNTGGITLSVMKNNEILKTYSVNMETDIIDADFDLKDGIYKYVINKRSGSLFAATVSLITEGDIIVGDINSFRFEDSKIVIEALTFENDERAELIKISRTYIDNIEYSGIMFAESEERDCPVYTGIMYFVNSNGERQEFSYEDTIDNKNRKLYKVNPVKIVYINDSTVEITNEDGDGLYYRKYYDKTLQSNKYLLTDHEYDFQNRGAYSLADLYIYKKAGK